MAQLLHRIPLASRRTASRGGNTRALASDPGAQSFLHLQAKGSRRLSLHTNIRAYKLDMAL